MPLLNKSYKLLRFLNRPPGPILRPTFSAVAWTATVVFTGRATLANGVARLIWAERNLKQGLRRLAWFASRGWLGLELVSDPVFDVSEGMSDQEVIAALSFVKKRSDPSLRGQLDLLTLLAAKLSPPMSAHDWNLGIQEFADVADQVLAEPLGSATEGNEENSERKGDFPVNAAANALRDFHDIFPNSDIPWFLVSGTFLGAVREGDFLPHDYDIDLGVREDVSLFDMAAQVRQDDRFSVLGMTYQETLKPVVGRMEKESSPVLLKLLHRDGVHVDVFGHFLDGYELWHGSQLHRWDNKDFELKAYPLAGISVFGAVDADLYLTENYGDWRTPRTGFNPSTGTPNLRIVHNLASVTLFLKRYAFARRDGDNASEHIVQLMQDGGYIVRDGPLWRLNAGRFRTSVAQTSRDA